MGVRRNAKRRRRARSAGGVDLISGLGDDVLVRILELLPDSRDAVRTGALSRRWRGLWTRILSLCFASDSWPEFRAASEVERYISMVDKALARRAAQTAPAIEHLAISFKLNRVCGREFGRILPPSIRAAQGWIWYAVQHTLKSFVLDLRLPASFYRRQSRSRMSVVMTLDRLPSSAKLETMRLTLGQARVQLPATAVFTSLTDLSLEHIIVAGSGNLLARLLSSACCPRLQKLRLRNLGTKLEKLLLEADVLSELTLEHMGTPHIIELRTPCLRVLRMEACLVEALTISAPRLEELTFLDDQPDNVYVDTELPHVRSLKVELWSHAYLDDEEINDGSNRLLQCCTSVKCLDVSLQVPKRENQVVDIIKGRIPHLLHVTSLTVHVWLPEMHSFGAGVASLVTQCSNLMYLRLHLNWFVNMEDDLESDFHCDHSDHWKSHEVSLAHLLEVELTGLVGTNCEQEFMQSVLSSATQLQKVAISFNKDYRLMDQRDASELLPVIGSGTWTACRGAYLSYKWMRHL